MVIHPGHPGLKVTCYYLSHPILGTTVAVLLSCNADSVAVYIRLLHWSAKAEPKTGPLVRHSTNLPLAFICYDLLCHLWYYFEFASSRLSEFEILLRADQVVSFSGRTGTVASHQHETYFFYLCTCKELCNNC